MFNKTRKKLPDKMIKNLYLRIRERHKECVRFDSLPEHLVTEDEVRKFCIAHSTIISSCLRLQHNLSGSETDMVHSGAYFSCLDNLNPAGVSGLIKIIREAHESE